MAQRNSEGVADDVLVRSVDWLLRAVVVVVLLVSYLSWLERSPIAALASGAVIAALLRAWRLAPWSGHDHRETLHTGRARSAAVANLDLMTGREFQQLVARLMDRDNVVGVRALGLRDDLSTDVIGHTPAGHKIVVQCKREAAHRRLDAPEVRRFLDTVRHEHAAEVAVLVTTGRFTPSAMALAARSDAILLDRRRLEDWMTGRATWLARSAEHAYLTLSIVTGCADPREQGILDVRRGRRDRGGARQSG